MWMGIEMSSKNDRHSHLSPGIGTFSVAPGLLRQVPEEEHGAETEAEG
jgi:hypothetical protein